MFEFETIYRILVWLGEEGIIRGVILLLILFFIIGLLSEKFRQSAPSLMINLGVLGTFCGIFMALYPLDFSLGKITESIGSLFNGIKIALITSLLGFAFAIVFRLTASLLQSFQFIASFFMDTAKFMPPEQRRILDQLDEIKQAISGQDGISLAAQLQELSDDNQHQFKQLENLDKTIRHRLAQPGELG